MGCCGDIGTVTKNLTTQMPGDIQVRPLWHAVQKTHGLVSQRFYGRINHKNTIWIDPRDFSASLYIAVTDFVALSPSPATLVQAANAAPPVNRELAMLERIAAAGVRVWTEPPQKVGYDMQQAPAELARFIVAMQDAGVRSVLEIGTGESSGLARFMVEQLGWNVVSVDLNEPNTPDSFKVDSRWLFLQGDSTTIDLDRIPTPPGGFDLVFIDGDHSYAGVKNDWERFGNLGKIVGFHDVAPDTWFKEGLAYYREIAYTKTGKLKKHWYESISPQSRAGIAWYNPQGLGLVNPPAGGAEE